MSREKAPAFQFYVRDWLGDANVQAMTDEARGVYINLLCYCWQEGALSASASTLSRLCRLTEVEFEQRIWPQLVQCFSIRNGKIRHKRLDKERAAQDAFRHERSQSGKRGAANRWGKLSYGSVNGSAILEPMAKNGSASATAVQVQPPLPPSGGIRITKRALKKAAEHRSTVWGRCPHEPKCQTYQDCIALIAFDTRSGA